MMTSNPLTFLAKCTLGLLLGLLLSGAALATEDKKHTVHKGETLYSIAHQYGVSVKAIKAENPGLKPANMAVGQVLLIPTQEEKARAATQAKAPEESKSFALKHRVEENETLYSICQRYKVEPEDVRKWNNLRTSGLQVGQALYIKVDDPAVIKKHRDKAEKPQKPKDTAAEKAAQPAIHQVGKGETLFSISRQYDVEVADIKEWNRLESNALSRGQELIIHPGKSENLPKNKNETKKKEEQQVTIEEVRSSYEKVVERGVAEVIKSENSTNKHLCLHKSAPRGTILQIKNELNGNVIFVRVVGKLSESQANRNLIVKVSEKAFEKLGSESNRFPVEVMYVP